MVQTTEKGILLQESETGYRGENTATGMKIWPSGREFDHKEDSPANGLEILAKKKIIWLWRRESDHGEENPNT